MEEARNKFIDAKRLSSYQKRKTEIDWFPLWLDYLQKRNQFIEHRIDFYKTER